MLHPLASSSLSFLSFEKESNRPPLFRRSAKNLNSEEDQIYKFQKTEVDHLYTDSQNINSNKLFHQSNEVLEIRTPYSTDFQPSTFGEDISHYSQSPQAYPQKVFESESALSSYTFANSRIEHNEFFPNETFNHESQYEIAQEEEKGKNYQKYDSSELAIEYEIFNKISLQNKDFVKAIDDLLSGQISFTDIDPNEYHCFEYAILSQLYKRKFTKPENQESNRRQEEKQKFFFKGLLKVIEQQFVDEQLNDKKAKRKSFDRNHFYAYYWGEIANKYEVDISNFYHPSKKIFANQASNCKAKPMHNPRFKSLNQQYIDLVMLSPLFKEEAIQYLNGQFQEECNKGRENKIENLIVRLQDFAIEIRQSLPNEDSNVIMDTICQQIGYYINTNSKCKLPWSWNELSEVKAFALQLINRKCDIKKLIKSLK